MSAPRAVRVVTEVAALDRGFDYLVPEGMDVAVGDRVRVNFHGRSVRGWVDALVEPSEEFALKPLKKHLGFGPPPQMRDLLWWASDRWIGAPRKFFGAASTLGLVRELPQRPTAPSIDVTGFTLYEPGVWRMGPTHDPLDLVLGAYAQTRDRNGSLLVLTPNEGWSSRLAERLRRRGLPVAVGDEDWALARAGWPVVVGTRGAAFSPVPIVAGAVVLDADDDAYVSEQSPTWDACSVLLERCRRAEAPLWLTTPLPSPKLSALSLPGHVANDFQSSWPEVRVVDRRATDPRDGALSQEVLELVSQALDETDGVAVTVILQRLGGARLVACRKCGEISRCETCRRPEEFVREDRTVDSGAEERGSVYLCPTCRRERDAFCRSCGSTAPPRDVVIGVKRLATEVAQQTRQRVQEVTAATTTLEPDVRVVVGTEAVFRFVRRTGLVIFADVDQYLLAPREEARRDAIYAVAKAARMVGSVAEGRGRVVVQTRRGDDDVISALRTRDFDEIIETERATAELLGLPPYGARAEIAREGAASYASALEAAGVPVQRDGDRFVVTAPSHEALSALLRAVPRPAEAIRLAIS